MHLFYRLDKYLKRFLCNFEKWSSNTLMTQEQDDDPVAKSKNRNSLASRDM